MPPDHIEVAIAIGALAAIFVASLLILIFIHRQKLFRRRDQSTNSQQEQLVKPAASHLELGDLCLHPDIEQILDNEQWIGDATGLVPHCLAVLKACHHLTERLAAIAMGPMDKTKLQKITEMARLTSSRVDDVVRCMYPPLDARLLEARSSVLVLTVSHLATATRHAARTKAHQRLLPSIEAHLDEMETHLQVLREASRNQECMRLGVQISVTNLQNAVK